MSLLMVERLKPNFDGDLKWLLIMIERATLELLRV